MRILRSYRNRGGSWGIVESRGESWRVAEGRGELWRVVGSRGESWGVVGSCGESPVDQSELFHLTVYRVGLAGEHCRIHEIPR